MEGFGTIPSGPDALNCGLLAPVDRDSPGLPERDPCLFGELYLRARAQTEYHHVRFKAVAARAVDAGDAPVYAVQRMDFDASVDLNTHGAHPFGDQGSHVRVEGVVEDSVMLSEHAGLQALMLKGLGNLKTDVAPTHYDRMPHTLPQQTAYRQSIVQGAQDMHARQIESSDRW